MVNWVGAKKTNKAYEEAERKKREKILEKIMMNCIEKCQII